MKKHFTAHVIFAATVMATQQAWALGFGRVVPDAVLGQTLFFSVPVHVEAGERFGLDCMSAEVYYGESMLLPSQVRATVERGSSDTDWLVRITTNVPIEEPVVEIAVSAGCERRFVRRFTAFADPPMVAAPTPGRAQVDTGTTPARPRQPGPIVAADVDGGARAPRRGADVSAAAPRPRAHSRKGPTLALASELDARAGASAGARAGAVAAPPRESVRTAPARVSATPAAAPRLVLDGGFAHLKLDIEEPIIPAPNAAASSAAQFALTELDDPDARQLRALEQGIQAMKRESQANRDQNAMLQSQLAAARSHDDWLPWLFGLLGLAVAAALALAWKLRQQARLAHSAWFTESQMVSKSPPEPAPAEPAVASAPAPLDAGPSIGGEVVSESPGIDLIDASSGGVIAELSTMATAPLDRSALAGVVSHDTSAPRELSVEELLDLEQQADFFIALGQEDAAVDLLMSHLRSAGGQSPLPYTKLLEIYRRQGDRSAYERTRARFNRRFNAYAPDWDTGPAAGRSLEDYPETVAQLQAAWHSPIDAMAILEGLLFKRDDTSELFDLPAYRDVLVLYSLARDLWQQTAGGSGAQVDVLLPLDDADYAAFQPQAPYAPASSIDGLDLPLDDSRLTSFQMTGYDALGGQGSILDPQMPYAAQPGDDSSAGRVDEGVHATLDALSLAPIAPAPPPAAFVPDGDDAQPADSSRRPKKR